MEKPERRSKGLTVKKDAEIGAFFVKTAQSVWEKSRVYQKPIFFLFVTTPVVLITQMSGESRARWLQMYRRLASKMTALPDRVSPAKVSLPLECCAAPSWSCPLPAPPHSRAHLVFIRRELQPAAEGFACSRSVPQRCPAWSHSPDRRTFFLPSLEKNFLRSNQNNFLPSSFLVL